MEKEKYFSATARAGWFVVFLGRKYVCLVMCDVILCVEELSLYVFVV